MSEDVKDGRGKVIKAQIKRVRSPEEVEERDRRLTEEPEYHLVVFHRSGRVVFEKNFVELADFDAGLPEEKGWMGKLHQQIIEEIEQFENSRKPKKDRKPEPPLPPIL